MRRGAFTLPWTGATDKDAGWGCKGGYCTEIVLPAAKVSGTVTYNCWPSGEVNATLCPATTG